MQYGTAEYTVSKTQRETMDIPVLNAEAAQLDYNLIN